MHLRRMPAIRAPASATHSLIVTETATRPARHCSIVEMIASCGRSVPRNRTSHPSASSTLATMLAPTRCRSLTTPVTTAAPRRPGARGLSSCSTLRMNWVVAVAMCSSATVSPAVCQRRPTS